MKLDEVAPEMNVDGGEARSLSPGDSNLVGEMRNQQRRLKGERPERWEEKRERPHMGDLWKGPQAIFFFSGSQVLFKNSYKIFQINQF